MPAQNWKVQFIIIIIIIIIIYIYFFFKTTLPLRPQSVSPGTLLKTVPEGNGIVTLKGYWNALKEEAGFAWVTRNGCQTLAYLPKKNRPILVNWAQGLDCDGNEIISLPHSCVFWDLTEWGLIIIIIIIHLYMGTFTVDQQTNRPTDQ